MLAAICDEVVHTKRDLKRREALGLPSEMQMRGAMLPRGRSSAASVPAAAGQENLPPREQRGHRDAATSRSTLKLLQLPKHQSPSSEAKSLRMHDATSSRSADRRQTRRSDRRMSPVAPLRGNHVGDVASLKLLGSQARRLPLKPREYVYEPAPKVARRADPPASKTTSINTEEATVSRAASSQAVTAVDDKVTQTSCANPSPVPKEGWCCSPICELPSEEKASRTLDKGEDRDVGVQCQLLENSRAAPCECVASMSIADRFPIWIDLTTGTTDGASHNEPMRYLQVATFMENPLHGSSSWEIAPRSVSLVVESDDDELRIAERGHTSKEPLETEIQVPSGDPQNQSATEAASAAHRQRYLLHFAASSAMDVVNSADEGVQALIKAKSDMDRMRQRLLELEELADGMDYEFKLTYQVSYPVSTYRTPPTNQSTVGSQRLGGDEDSQRDNDKMRTRRVLSQVDQLLHATTPHGIGDNDGFQPPASTGVLVEKAASDAVAARALLEQLEQLTLRRGDDAGEIY